SWTRASWKGSLKISVGRSLLACLPSVVALIAALVFAVVWVFSAASAIAADLHGRVLPAGNGAPDQEQVALGIDLDDVRAALGDALRAHLAGHAHPLEDARRIGARADRARSADVVGAVRLRAAAEVVPLDRALEALADRDCGHLHPLAR